ncbi:nuclease-related domain-containing protein [Nocardioides sp. CFH 31398]|uniref:nuclease-related domain-containing protein n=1 Tax=Nocardioides sp. CFH 31398 TaxID=2919579 RepID=UPI001F0589C8|nr:nuclease-related domain-containing protein [Nocardioides sp. CFH 31398]MCH1867606.1 NERD domain-containing protein [Nocardioides sp. CFH 31398]
MVDILDRAAPLRWEAPWARWRTRRAAAAASAAPASRAVTSALAGLDGSRWHVLTDVELPEPPDSRRLLESDRTRVEHVVVGPAGVLVMGSRNWNSAIRTAQGVLRQDGARRERDLAEASRSAAVVRDAYGIDEDVPVIGVLCFVPPAMVTGWIGEVLLCATGDVVAVLDRLARRLDRDEVDALAARLGPGAAATTTEDAAGAAGTRAAAVGTTPVLQVVEGQAGA